MVGWLLGQNVLMRILYVWQQYGMIVLWCYIGYQCNFFGWYFSCDVVGCVLLQGLIDVLLVDGIGVVCMVWVMLLFLLLFVVFNNCCVVWEVFVLVWIGYDVIVDGQGWQYEGDWVYLCLNVGVLVLFRQGVNDIVVGWGDYVMGIGVVVLWFWWWLLW